jgi:hypothetical protein
MPGKRVGRECRRRHGGRENQNPTRKCVGMDSGGRVASAARARLLAGPKILASSVTGCREATRRDAAAAERKNECTQIGGWKGVSQAGDAGFGANGRGEGRQMSRKGPVSTTCDEF